MCICLSALVLFFMKYNSRQGKGKLSLVIYTLVSMSSLIGEYDKGHRGKA